MKELTILIDENLYKRFEMALQLDEESRDAIIDKLLRSYVARIFSQEASSYDASKTDVKTDNYGKALHKIPLWAKRTSQANHKIIRAFFQLAKDGPVSYQALAERCQDETTHPDTYVEKFSSNFAQMKLDSAKSNGKVFEVDQDGIVSIWKHVEQRLNEYKEAFLVHTTDTGYLNRWNQRNIGRTDEQGTDHMQYLYMMRCEECGYEYFANGSDIFQKRCPQCQGGKDTGME